MSVSRELRPSRIGEALRVAYDVDIGLDDDAEIVYFNKLADRVERDREQFDLKLSDVANRRIADPSERAEVGHCLAQLGGLHSDGAIGAFVYGEAAQICLVDSVMLSELTGSLSPPAARALRQYLVEQSLGVVERLIRNLSERLVLRSEGPHPWDESRVRPLSDVVLDSYSTLDNMFDRKRAVVMVLTAGRGTRLRTTIPKALVPVGGRPMVEHVVGSAMDAGIDQVAFIVGHRAVQQEDYLRQFGPTVVQRTVAGTGHSAMYALLALGDHTGPIVLCFSDTPLVGPESFSRPIDMLNESDADMVISTFQHRSDDNLGRIARYDDGSVKSVEQPRLGGRVSSEADGGIYAVRMTAVLEALGTTYNANARYEYQFPDVVQVLALRQRSVVTCVGSSEEFLGVNVPSDLAEARRRFTGTEMGMSGGGSDIQSMISPLAGLGEVP